MNFWVMPDLHLGHNKMHDYCKRPFGFETKILNQIKHKVKPDDVLIVIGDFCVYRDEYWHERLVEYCPGKKWLCRGNHDRKSLTWYLAHGWDFVAESIIINAFGKRIALSHKPLTLWDDSDDFDINVHGHHHNTLHHPEDEVSKYHKLLFIEHDYSPINLRKAVGA